MTSPARTRRFHRTGLLIAFHLCLCVFIGCGGGGGGGGDDPPEVIDLGLRSSTTTSKAGRTFLNPLNQNATVTALPAIGPFSFDPNDLPTIAVASGPITIDVLFTPDGPGAASAIIGLRFSAGGNSVDRFFEAKAVAENVPWTVGPSPVDFGDILPGDSATVDVTLRNESALSPVTFTSATVPAQFELDPDPFPFTVSPGFEATVSITYTSDSIGPGGGVLRMGPNDPGGKLDISLGADSTGSGQRIINFGSQTLTNGETPELSFDVPASAVSITLEGVMSDADQVGLLTFEGPGNKVYENVTETGPVKWIESKKAFAVHIPSSDRSSTQLVAGGGTYTFKLRRISGSSATMDVRVILELRAQGPSQAAILPLNIFLAQGVTPTKTTAESDANLQSMLTQVNQILSAQNITLGEITYYDIADAAFNDLSIGEEEQLFRTSSAAADVRLNLFLVNKVWDGLLLGISGSIDGAPRNGDLVTGVASFYFDGQPGAVAAIVAHEICHYLGLWHSVEGDSSVDEIDDTPECLASSIDPVCTGQLMFFQGNGGTSFTNGQGLVVRGHPLLHPAGTTQTFQRLAPEPWVADQATIEFLSAHGSWCGTRHRR